MISVAIQVDDQDPTHGHSSYLSSLLCRLYSLPQYESLISYDQSCTTESLLLHQGVVLDCSPLSWLPMDELPQASHAMSVAAAASLPPPVFLALDEVMDPVRGLLTAPCIAVAKGRVTTTATYAVLLGEALHVRGHVRMPPCASDYGSLLSGKDVVVRHGEMRDCHPWPVVLSLFIIL
jgi:hypothetical protein